MQSLFVLSLLGAAAASQEPVRIEVPTHALATVGIAKAQQRSVGDFVERAAHAMSARVDANGRVHYNCADAAATRDLRLDTRATREER